MKRILSLLLAIVTLLLSTSLVSCKKEVELTPENFEEYFAWTFSFEHEDAPENDVIGGYDVTVIMHIYPIQNIAIKNCSVNINWFIGIKPSATTTAKIPVSGEFDIVAKMNVDIDPRKLKDHHVQLIKIYSASGTIIELY